MAYATEKEPKFGPMGQNTKGNDERIKPTDMEYSYALTEITTKVNGSPIKQTDMESILNSLLQKFFINFKISSR